MIVMYVLLVSSTCAKDDTVHPLTRRYPTRSAMEYVVTPRYTHTQYTQRCVAAARGELHQGTTLDVNQCILV